MKNLPIFLKPSLKKIVFPLFLIILPWLLIFSSLMIILALMILMGALISIGVVYTRLGEIFQEVEVL